MNKKNWFFILFLFNCFFSHDAGHSLDAPSVKTEDTLEINIPVKIKKGNVVFNIGQVALLNNESIALGHVKLLSNDFKAQNVKGEIIALFHTGAGYMMLDDKKYNEFRRVNTGNPYKAIIVNFMNQGVRFELCGATAAAHQWVNANLIPNVKVNTDAMIRLTQLGQDGFVIINE